MQSLGRYEILEELGHGAMGAVYRARDPKIDRIVALKTIRVLGASAEDEEAYRQRFVREAQAAGKLSHPGIVTIYDVGEDEATKTPYIVMEHVAGRTLESLLAEAGPAGLPRETALDLAQQVAEALDYAHSHGIVHRDIKPANILVTAEGRAKITDFGIAKLTMTQFTLPGELLGTPSYMSPEQVSGGVVDARSDLFSLGIILYRALTGEKPFAGDNLTAVSFQITYKDPIPATQRNASLSADFDRVLARALAKDPARRYQRGKEFADDLQALRQGRALQSESTVILEPELEKTLLQKDEATLPAAQPIRQPVPAPAHVSRPIAASPKRRPYKAYVAAAAAIGAIVLGLLAYRIWAPTPLTTLRVTSQHSFLAADLSLWIDDKLTYEGKLTGVERRRLGIFKSVEGSFSEAVPVPVGQHVVRVRVRSLGDGYDQTSQLRADFRADAARTLQLTFGKNKALSLLLR